MGTVSTHKFWRAGYSLLASAFFVLGCAAGDGPSSVDFTDDSLKTAAETAEQIQSSEDVSISGGAGDFTTEGKLTKIIETPWGPREIYDPAQDQEVLTAIENIYDRENVSFEDVSRLAGFGASPEDDEVSTVQKSRQIHYLDMVRLGCRRTIDVPCQYFGSLYLKTSCTTYNFGSSLNECERKNITTDFTELSGPLGILPKNEKKYKYIGENPTIHWTAHECRIGGIQNKVVAQLRIGEVSGYNLDETKALLTSSECSEWSANSEFSVLSSKETQ